MSPLVSALGGDLRNQLRPHQLRTKTTSRLKSAPQRLRTAAVPTLQCSVAAGLAWLVAVNLVGHHLPFFAPVAAVVALGVGTVGKVRRSIELVLGVSLGVGVGDLLISQIGSGAWQISLVVALAIGVALIFDAGPVITVQSASSAVLVATLMPPGDSASFDRMIDTFIGGLLGLVVMALIPVHPLARARRESAAILRKLGTVLRMCASGLTEQDSKAIVEALTLARTTQPDINSLRAQVRGGREVSRMAPMHWRHRHSLIELGKAVDGIDNAVRNVRVMVRRCLAIVREDEILDAGLVDEIEKLSDATAVLAAAFAPRAGQDARAEAARVLRLVAKGAKPELVRTAGVSAHTVFAQLRSTLVDLLQAAGVERSQALATLPVIIAPQAKDA